MGGTPASGVCVPASVGAGFSKVRINPITLAVDTSDQTFATSSGAGGALWGRQAPNGSLSR